MKEAKKAELIQKHSAARRRLRAEGAEESLGNVLKLAGGSKRDIVALWTESDPDVAPLPMTDAEAAFRQTFAAYLEAAIRFHAISGRGHYDLPEHHPWYKDLKEAVGTAYEAHLKAWAELEDREEAARPAPEPAPPPPPPPAFDTENLRKYYFNQGRSPWPGGVSLPAEQAVYDILKQLWKDAEALETQSGRERYAVLNALGQIPGAPDQTPLRMAEDRWSAARYLAHRIKGDMDQMTEKARYEGRTLTT